MKACDQDRRHEPPGVCTQVRVFNSFQKRLFSQCGSGKRGRSLTQHIEEAC